MADHYAVLEVPATADSREIRAAYRRLALELHPDRAGATSTRAFQHLVEAYAVLSDPEQRARYDARRAARGHAARPAARARAANSAAGTSAAGTSAGTREASSSTRPSSTRTSSTRASPPPPAAAKARRAAPILLSRLSGPLASVIGRGAARRAPGGVIELLLNEEEAASGGYATISVSTPDLLSHWVTIPAGTADGATITSVAGTRSARSELTFCLRIRR